MSDIDTQKTIVSTAFQYFQAMMQAGNTQIVQSRLDAISKDPQTDQWQVMFSYLDRQNEQDSFAAFYDQNARVYYRLCIVLREKVEVH